MCNFLSHPLMCSVCIPIGAMKIAILYKNFLYCTDKKITVMMNLTSYESAKKHEIKN